MDIKHITSQSLRHLLSLTSKKEKLIQGVEDLENEISKTLKGVATSVVEVAEVIVPPKSARKSTSKKAGKSVGLKQRILDLLEAAGDEGLRVKEIAEKLGSKTGNISVWFSTTGKKHARKVEPGRYAAKGAPSAAAVKPVKAKRKLSAKGRAKTVAGMKARRAARRAAKPARKAKKKA